jgi:outer membrane protein assembly factor BamB
MKYARLMPLVISLAAFNASLAHAARVFVGFTVVHVGLIAVAEIDSDNRAFGKLFELEFPPVGLAFSGNTLYVAQGNVISEFNATTGEVINTNFIGVTGQLALSGNTLYVAQHNGVISEYNATTGAPINTNFIGISGQLAISGNTLYVGHLAQGNGVIGAYDATTGAAINANLINAGPAFAVLGNDLFAELPNGIGKFDAATGAVIDPNFVTQPPPVPFPEPPPLPTSPVGASGNDLFAVGSAAPFNIEIAKYDATTGALIDSFASSPGPVLVVPDVAPEPATWTMIAVSGILLLASRRRKKL